MTDLYHIYILIHPKTQKVVWVGSSCRIYYRFVNHKCNFKRDHGYDPIKQVLFISTDMDKAKELEYFIIELYKKEGAPLLNKYARTPGKTPMEYSTPREIKRLERDLDYFMQDEDRDTF